MYNIFFYEDAEGNRPVEVYLSDLAKKSDKDSRINFNKMVDYMQALSVHGTYAGEPYIKHLDGEIWELRPLRNRILFAAWIDNSFILLHHFLKKTQKTPQREIDQAKRELADIKERGIKDD